jgi:AAA domain
MSTLDETGQVDDPWAPGVRASDVPINSESCQAAAPLCPNRADIERHLNALFSPLFVHPYPEAWIEIAWGNPANGGRLNQAKHFSVFDLPAAAEFAEAKSMAGDNVYVGVALRRGETAGRSNGRASGGNTLTASHAWAEFDHEGDAARIDAVLRDKSLLTAFTITTGRTPHQRAHLYFKLADRATVGELKDANTALKTLLGSDDVQNPDRVMRLAGTINYPTPKKAERGYVPELVTLDIRKNAAAYTVEQLTSLADQASRGTEFNSRSGRSDNELEALLEASLQPGYWHNCVRDAIATMIGRGWCDDAIRFACTRYCRDGYGDADLDDLIEGARKKWAKPNPEPSPASQQTPSTGIKLDYYESFDTAVSKNWIVKGVIAKGETSSWIGPPGAAKSALLIDLIIGATSSADWRGYRSKEPVGVVYFALERGQLVKRRLMAHAMRSKQPPKLPIAVAGQIIDLLNPNCVTSIVDAIRAAEAHYSCTVGVIVVDTYGKGIAAGGGDENSAKDQNRTLANLRRIQELTGVHIALVGHTGKDESKGARGSNAHLGDVDLMIQISVDEAGVRTAIITKCNDGAEGVLTRFKLEVVTLGIDDDGDEINTAVVADDRLDTEKEMNRAKLNKSQRKAMEMLERAIIDFGKPGPISSEYPTKIKVVSVEQWRAACLKGGLSPAGTKESADKAFRRAMIDLDALHRIGIWDGLVWIAYE